MVSDEAGNTDDDRIDDDRIDDNINGNTYDNSDDNTELIEVPYVPSPNDICMWCGVVYDKHKDRSDPRVTPRMPCGGLKSGFSPRIRAQIRVEFRG